MAAKPKPAAAPPPEPPPVVVARPGLNLLAFTAAPWWPLVKYGLMALVAVIAIALVANWWNDLWSWLPWSAESRAARAEAAAETSAGQASTAALQTEGAQETIQRVEVVVTQRRAADAATAALTTQARSSDDADQPLAPDRARRLRDHDGELCRLRPSLAGCAEPAETRPTAARRDAEDGERPVRPLQAPE